MIRPGALVWIGATVIVAIAMFLIVYRVKGLETELASLNQEALAHEEAIHVLKAEWGFLNRPERLAELAERYLALEPVSAAQLTAAKLLDEPPAAVAAASPSERLQDMLRRVTDEGER